MIPLRGDLLELASLLSTHLINKTMTPKGKLICNKDEMKFTNKYFWNIFGYKGQETWLRSFLVMISHPFQSR